MKPEVPGYLKEIENVGWVQEVIMERFDNALELMLPDSIIYGGAVRDCIAGKELLGDLDLAVTPEDFDSMSETFQTNPKWIPLFQENEPIKARCFSDKPVFKIKSSGDLAKELAPMSGVSSFITMGEKTVQLITSKYQDRDPLQSAIYVARMVDIVCCGMIMLCDGRVFEAIPGAYQDCIDGVLRLNKSSDTIYLDALGPRVEKLVNRGWKNTINVAKVIKEIEDSREKAKRKEQRLMELRSKRNDTSPLEGLKEYNFMYDKTEDKPVFGGYMQEITKEQIDAYFTGHPDECRRTLELFAAKDSMNMRIKQTPTGSVYYETANSIAAHKIQRRLQIHFEKHSRGKRSVPVAFKDGIISAKYNGGQAPMPIQEEEGMATILPSSALPSSAAGSALLNSTWSACSDSYVPSHSYTISTSRTSNTTSTW